MVHEIGVFECACPHIFGMFSPYPTFQNLYLTTQISITPQKYIKLIPNTSSTLVTLELSFQTAIPMHYTLICVHGPIYMDHGAPLARFSCPKPFCPNFRPDCPTTQNFSPENFMDQIFPEIFFRKFFRLIFFDRKFFDPKFFTQNFVCPQFFEPNIFSKYFFGLNWS